MCIDNQDVYPSMTQHAASLALFELWMFSTRLPVTMPLDSLPKKWQPLIKGSGECEYRSRRLPHAKRALYQWANPPFCCNFSDFLVLYRRILQPFWQSRWKQRWTKLRRRSAVVGTVVRCGRETSNSEAKHFHLIMRHLYACKLKFVTPHEESTKNKLWIEKDFTHTCSREWLTEKAARIENNLSERARKRAPWSLSLHRWFFEPSWQFWWSWNWTKLRRQSAVVRHGRAARTGDLKLSCEQRCCVSKKRLLTAHQKHRAKCLGSSAQSS